MSSAALCTATPCEAMHRLTQNPANEDTGGRRINPAAIVSHARTRRILIAALFVSLLLGLNLTDETGFRRSAGLLSATNVLRAFAFVSLLMLMLATARRRLDKLLTRPAVILIIFYLFALIPVYFNMGLGFTTKHIRIYLSLSEWFILSLLAAFIFNFPLKLNFAASVEAFRQFFAYTSLFIATFVVIIAIIEPQLAFFPAKTWSFGAYIMHPNRLSVICALGIACWLSDHRSRWRFVVPVGLLLVALASGSRSGIFDSLFMFGYGLISFLPRRHVRGAQWVAVFTALLLILFFFGFSDLFISEQQQGALSNLNGRDAVWRGTRYMISHHPWLGSGWIEGPKKIGLHTGENWWFARNAQNDVLNFAVASGLPVAAIAAAAYAWMLIVGLRTMFDPKTRLIFGAAVCLLVSSLVEPLTSTVATPVGLASLMLLVVTFKRPARAAPGRGRRRLPTRAEPAAVLRRAHPQLSG